MLTFATHCINVGFNEFVFNICKEDNFNKLFILKDN